MYSVQPPGWLGGEGDEQGGGTPSLNLQSHSHPPRQEASPSSGGARTQPPPNAPHPAPIAHPASSSQAEPGSCGRGGVTRSGAAAQTGHPPSGPQAALAPRAGPGPAAQQACADLATYRYLLHRPRGRGSLRSEAPSVPLPLLDPSTGTTKTSSRETPTSPIRPSVCPSRPGKADLPRRPLPWPCHPARRASGRPPLEVRLLLP